MRSTLVVVVLLAAASTAVAEDPAFQGVVKASLVFREDAAPNRHYPHLLQVFLRLENLHDSEIDWVADGIGGVEAELFDSAGKTVPQGPQAGSVGSSSLGYRLPYGSRLDWLISHGGVSLGGDEKDNYALIVGERGWLVPINTADSYSLRICLRGMPWTMTVRPSEQRKPQLLFDVPPKKIEVEKPL